MKNGTSILVPTLTLSAALIGIGISPAAAQAAPVEAKTAEASVSFPSASPDDLADRMPDTMTDEQMEAWAAGRGTPAAESNENARAAIGDYCNLVPGQMWKRSSGSGYPHGAVGSKPALTNCTAGVVTTTMTSNVYMHNGWIWVKKAGPSISYGHGNMVDKKVIYVCANVNTNSWQVATLASGTNAAGAYHEATDSTGSYSLGCG